MPEFSNMLLIREGFVGIAKDLKGICGPWMFALIWMDHKGDFPVLPPDVLHGAIKIDA